jgi:RNA polymerase-binding protein DksA
VTHFSSADIEAYKQHLSDRRTALVGYLRAAMTDALREQTSEAGRRACDVGEESFAELTFGVDLAARSREIQELQDIDAALKRIAEGTFGYCLNCNAEIGTKRLLAFPTAKRCLPCQQRHEKIRSLGADISPSL